MVISAGNVSQFKALCNVLDKPKFAQEDRFKTNPERVKHLDELIPKLQHSFATKPTAYWQGKCRERNIPCPNHGEHQIEIMDQLKITNDNKGAI